MAVSRNKLIPIAGVTGMLVIGGILYTNSSSKPAQSAMSQVPLPTTTGADQDTPQETLATVVQSNRELRQDVQKVIDINNEPVLALANYHLVRLPQRLPHQQAGPIKVEVRRQLLQELQRHWT